MVPSSSMLRRCYFVWEENGCITEQNPCDRIDYFHTLQLETQKWSKNKSREIYLKMKPVLGMNSITIDLQNIEHIYLPHSWVPSFHTLEDIWKENISMFHLDGSVGFKKQEVLFRHHMNIEFNSNQLTGARLCHNKIKCF